MSTEDFPAFREICECERIARAAETAQRRFVRKRARRAAWDARIIRENQPKRPTWRVDFDS